MFNVVLHEPRIPQNAGNIARLCAATGCSLHLIRPLGFRLDHPGFRRAGLDYLDAVDLTVHDTFDAFESQFPLSERFFLLSKKGKRLYSDPIFKEGDVLLFGSEEEGLPTEMLESRPQQTLRIPIIESNVRSLNLASAVAIVVYEALRQKDFSFF